MALVFGTVEAVTHYTHFIQQQETLVNINLLFLINLVVLQLCIACQTTSLDHI